MKLRVAFFLALVLTHQCYASLFYAPPPPNAEQVVRKKLSNEIHAVCVCVDGVHYCLDGLNELDIKDLTLGGPIREYFISKKDVAAGRSFSALKAGNWQYLIFRGTNCVGAAGCAQNVGNGNAVECYNICTNHYAMQALRVAEQSQQVKGRDYEVRWFKASIFNGIWLHSTSDDIFIPADDGYGNGRWVAYQKHSREEVSKIIKSLQNFEIQNMQSQKEANDEWQEYKAALTKGIKDYEKAHGNARSQITLNGIGTYQSLSPDLDVVALTGMSINGGIVNYKAQVRYKDKHHFVIKSVAVLPALNCEAKTSN